MCPTIIYYLRAIPWQIPDFEIDDYEIPLRKLHQSIEETGACETKAHRFFLECIKEYANPRNKEGQ